ncbi:MAG TPA: hypothetical protein VGK17_22075 [Propionicimonas sp.]
MTGSPGQDCGYFIETGATVCVPHGADLNGAIYAQTGKTVVEMSANGVTALTAPESKPASSGMTVSPASNSFIIGKLFDDINYGGGSYEILASGPCASGTPTWYLNDVGSAWYGRVSSFQGYSNCNVTIYEGTYQTGAQLGPLSYSAWVGAAMNDRTKSVKLTY